MTNQNIAFRLLCQGTVLGMAVSAVALVGSAQAGPTKGGTLTVGLETDVRGFDTFKGGIMGISGRTVAGSMEEPLLMFDPTTGKYNPHLALEWKNSDDGKQWTVKLRKGVKFHDGNDFDAKDVVDQTNGVLDPKRKSRSRGFITAIANAEVVDSHTIRYNLKHPWQGFLPVLAGRNMGAGLIQSPEQTAADKQNRHPIGTGPFIFQEWRGGDRIVVTKNPNYWNKDVIHLDKIVYRILPDPQTRFQTVKAGDVDLIWTDRGSSIRAAEKDKGLKVFKQPGPGSGLTLLNASKPPLDNEIVRQAVRHSMNQKAINAVLWKNTRSFVEHPMGHKCGDVKYPHHSIEKAKELVKQYGKPIKLEMIHTTTPRGREFGEINQQLMKKAGIELKLIPVDQNILVKRVFTNEYMMSGWRVADSIDVGAQLFGLSFSKSPYNITRNKKPDLDKLSLAMRTAKTMEQRQQRQCDLVAYINNTGNMAFGSGNLYHIIMQPNVMGMRPFTFGSAEVWRLWKDKG